MEKKQSSINFDRPLNALKGRSKWQSYWQVYKFVSCA